MGKTKIKTIDDSQPEVEKSKKERKKILGANIERDQKLKKVSKEEVKSEDVSSRADQSLSELGHSTLRDEPIRLSSRPKPSGSDSKSEDGQRAQALTSTTPSEPVLSHSALSSWPKGLSKEASLTGKQSDIELKEKKKLPPKSKKVHSKKYQQALEKVDRGKFYPIDEATQLVKEVSYSEFDGTLEIHINTSVKNVRGLVNLPFASGKKLKIMAFPSASLRGREPSGRIGSGQIKELKEQGVIVGDEELLEEIGKGKINFDVLVTTPQWMPKLAKVAKVLGPKGLMPNPKNGTITDDLKKTVSELQGGKTNYKTESKANIIHLGVGKVSQPKEELSQNIKVLLSSIGKTKIKKAILSPTMGPGVKLDLSSI